MTGGAGGPFVGRAGELEALDALTRWVLGGRPAAGVVIAEPGIGKSRLLAELDCFEAFPKP